MQIVIKQIYIILLDLVGARVSGPVSFYPDWSDLEKTVLVILSGRIRTWPFLECWIRIRFSSGSDQDLVFFSS